MSDDTDENEIMSLTSEEADNSVEGNKDVEEKFSKTSLDEMMDADSLNADLENKIKSEFEINPIDEQKNPNSTEPASLLSLDDYTDDILNDIQNQLLKQTSTPASSPVEEVTDNSSNNNHVAILESDIDNLIFGNEAPKPTPISDNTGDLDSLFGTVGLDDLSASVQSGMDAILKKTMIYYERLPMLEVVFDRLIRLLSTSLRNFTSDNVEIRTEASISMRFGEYLNSIPLPAMIGVFKAEEWDNQGLIVVDSELTYSVVDVLLGGRHSSSSESNEGRTYTTIECNLIQKLMVVFLEELSAAFEPICAVNFTFERLDLNPHFAMISRASNAGILLKLSVEINDRYGKITLFLPYATIEPIRELLLQNFMGEKFGRDSIWEHHLVDEIKSSELSFNVHLANEMMHLYEVLNWRIGDIINFSCPPPDLVVAKCGDQDLFTGMVGHKNGKIAIKIKDNLLRKSLDEEGNIE